MALEVAVIGGSGLYEAAVGSKQKGLEPDTPYGKPSGPIEITEVHGRPVAFLARHGKGHAIPAHRVPHRANLWALKELGVKEVISTSSVGSLHLHLKPRTFAIPHDFICPWEVPTYYDDKVFHVTPGLDEGLRRKLFYKLQELELPVVGQAVYIQTKGPRLETPAEIRMLAQYGDLVGMTMASEAVLASELGLRYASVCSVDNYCNGITEGPLTYEEIMKAQGENAENLRRVIMTVLEAMA